MIIHFPDGSEQDLPGMDDIEEALAGSNLEVSDAWVKDGIEHYEVIEKSS